MRTIRTYLILRSCWALKRDSTAGVWLGRIGCGYRAAPRGGAASHVGRGRPASEAGNIWSRSKWALLNIRCNRCVCFITNCGDGCTGAKADDAKTSRCGSAGKHNSLRSLPVLYRGFCPRAKIADDRILTQHLLRHKKCLELQYVVALCAEP